MTSGPLRFARNVAILEEDPTLGIASPTVAWANTAFRAMHEFRAVNYPLKIRQPLPGSVYGGNAVRAYDQFNGQQKSS